MEQYKNDNTPHSEIEKTPNPTIVERDTTPHSGVKKIPNPTIVEKDCCNYCQAENAKEARYCANCGRLIHNCREQIVLTKDVYNSITRDSYNYRKKYEETKCDLDYYKQKYDNTVWHKIKSFVSEYWPGLIIFAFCFSFFPLSIYYIKVANNSPFYSPEMFWGYFRFLLFLSIFIYLMICFLTEIDERTNFITRKINDIFDGHLMNIASCLFLFWCAAGIVCAIIYHISAPYYGYELDISWFH